MRWDVTVSYQETAGPIIYILVCNNFLSFCYERKNMAKIKEVSVNFKMHGLLGT